MKESVLIIGFVRVLSFPYMIFSSIKHQFYHHPLPFTQYFFNPTRFHFLNLKRNHLKNHLNCFHHSLKLKTIANLTHLKHSISLSFLLLAPLFSACLMLSWRLTHQYHPLDQNLQTSLDFPTITNMTCKASQLG